MRTTYEAGPTGFGLARTLHEAGHRVQVAAPSKSIQPPEDRGQDRPQRCNAAGPSGQRLGKLALRNGYVFPGKTSWRKEHRAWLRGIRRDELGGAGIGTLMTFDDCDDTVQHA